MNKIITVGREFGSGGRELGRRMAELLGYAYYDYEIISEIAKRTELSEEYVQRIIEKRPVPFFPITTARSFAVADDYATRQSIQVYEQQKRIIEEMANNSNSVFVGRCADYILQDKKPFRVFVCAELESKIERCKRNASTGEKLSDKEIRKNIAKIDRNRAQYYEFYTSRIWGDKLNYDLCINTTNLNIERLAAVVIDLL